MKKIVGGSCALLLLCSLTGWSQESFQKLVEEMIKLTGDVGDVLATVKDKQTAEKASPKVQALSKSLKDLKARSDKIAKPTPEDLKVLETKYGEQLKAAMLKFMTETKRLAAVEGGPRLLLDLDITGRPSPGGKVVLDVKDKLTAADVKDKQQKDSYAKSHAFKMASGKIYTIDLQSSTFDTFLRLEDPAGKELGSDDDGGGNLNSRLVFTAPKDDTYRIVVTTFEGGKTGDYSLIVRQAEEPETKTEVKKTEKKKKS